MTTWENTFIIRPLFIKVTLWTSKFLLVSWRTLAYTPKFNCNHSLPADPLSPKSTLLTSIWSSIAIMEDLDGSWPVDQICASAPTSQQPWSPLWTFSDTLDHLLASEPKSPLLFSEQPWSSFWAFSDDNDTAGNVTLTLADDNDAGNATSTLAGGLRLSDDSPVYFSGFGLNFLIGTLLHCVCGFGFWSLCLLNCDCEFGEKKWVWKTFFVFMSYKKKILT